MEMHILKKVDIFNIYISYDIRRAREYQRGNRMYRLMS